MITLSNEPQHSPDIYYITFTCSPYSSFPFLLGPAGTENQSIFRGIVLASRCGPLARKWGDVSSRDRYGWVERGGDFQSLVLLFCLAVADSATAMDFSTVSRLLNPQGPNIPLLCDDTACILS